jgi:hypothetical protein
VLVGVAEREIVIVVPAEAFDAEIPELTFDAADAALGPLGGDEGIDERALVGVGGVEVEQEFLGKSFELGRIFSGDDLRTGVDAGFEGVERGGGFAFGGSWAGRFLGIQAIRVNLCIGRHNWKPLERLVRGPIQVQATKFRARKLREEVPELGTKEYQSQLNTEAPVAKAEMGVGC